MLRTSATPTGRNPARARHRVHGRGRGITATLVATGLLTIGLTTIDVTNPPQAAAANLGDPSAAEGLILALSSLGIDLAGCGRSVGSNPTGPLTDTQALECDILQGLLVNSQANGLGAALPNINIPLLSLLNLGDANSFLSYADTPSQCVAHAASGAITTGGSFDVGNPDFNTNPGSVDLTGILDDLGVGGLTNAILDQFQLTFGALASRADSVNRNVSSSYSIADLGLDIRTPAIGGLTDLTRTALGAIVDPFAQLVDAGGALALQGALAVSTAATTIPNGAGWSLAPPAPAAGSGSWLTNVSSVVFGPGLNAPAPTVTLTGVDTFAQDVIDTAMSQPLANADNSVVIDLSTGTVHVDLAKLAVQTWNNDPAKPLGSAPVTSVNDLPPNYLLTSGNTLSLALGAINDLILGTGSDSLITKITNAANAAYGNIGMTVTVPIDHVTTTTTRAALPPTTTRTDDGGSVTLSGNLAAWSDPSTALGSRNALTANVTQPGGGAPAYSTQTLDAIADQAVNDIRPFLIAQGFVNGTLYGAEQIALPLLNGLGLTLQTVFDTAVTPLVNVLTSLTNMALFRLVINEQEGDAANAQIWPNSPAPNQAGPQFPPAPYGIPDILGGFTVRALSIQLLPIASPDALARIDLASSSVKTSNCLNTHKALSSSNTYLTPGDGSDANHAPTVAGTGQNISYNFTVTNSDTTSGDTISEVTVADKLYLYGATTPSSETLVAPPVCSSVYGSGGPGTPAGSGSACTGTTATLAPGDSAVFTATYQTTSAAQTAGGVYDCFRADGTGAGNLADLHFLDGLLSLGGLFDWAGWAVNSIPPFWDGWDGWAGEARFGDLTSRSELSPLLSDQSNCVYVKVVTVPTVVSLYLQKQHAPDAASGWTGLPGSQFAIYDDNNGQLGTNQVVACTSGDSTGTSGSSCNLLAAQDGLFQLAIAPGTYWLVETKAPAGYELLAQPVKFTVTGTGSGTDASAVLDAAAGSRSVIAGAASDQPTIDTVGSLSTSSTAFIAVRDVAAFILPDTGGSGMAPVWWAAGGLYVLALALAAAWLLPRRRRPKPAR
jgi:hypothetical protein